MNELVTFCPEVMGTDTRKNHRMGSDGGRKRKGGSSRMRDEEDEMNGEWKNPRGMKGPDRCLEANEGGNPIALLRRRFSGCLIRLTGFKTELILRRFLFSSVGCRIIW